MLRVEEVSMSIVDTIGAHVELRQAGEQYTGLCPFHDEQTPSFFVRPREQDFHCFGCGAHGSESDFTKRVTG
jgi:DNA primase